MLPLPPNRQRVEFTGLQVQPTPVFTGRPVYRFTAKFTGFPAKLAGFTAKFAEFTAKFTGFTVKFTGFTASVNIRVGFRFAWVYRFIFNPLPIFACTQASTQGPTAPKQCLPYPAPNPQTISH